MAPELLNTVFKDIHHRENISLDVLMIACETGGFDCWVGYFIQSLNSDFILSHIGELFERF